MSTVYSNLFVNQGASFTKIFDLTDKYKQPIDITDIEIQGRLSRSYSSTSYVTFDVEILDYTYGKVKISLTATATTSLVAGRYVYEIMALDPYGNVTKIVEGLVDVTPGVGVITSQYIVSGQ